MATENPMANQENEESSLDRIYLIVLGDFSDFCVVSAWTSKKLAEDEIVRIRSTIPFSEGSELHVDTHMLNSPVSEDDFIWRKFKVQEPTDG